MLDNKITLGFGEYSNFDNIPGTGIPNHYFNFTSYNQLQSRVPQTDVTSKIQYPILTVHVVQQNSEGEGGADVFKFEYKKQLACLAQSHQLHKQMAICGDFKRAFVVGTAFSAEDSYTHRHSCEYTGLDVEMIIKEHCSEILRNNLKIDQFSKCEMNGSPRPVEKDCG
ncbi:aspartate--tRNA ligase 2, cytoplasmic-like protein [Tanacetum coccineum]